MGISDLVSGVNRMQKATKELQQQWTETRTHWDDQTSREYEEKYLQPILPRIRLVLAAVHELNELFDRAGRECRDDFTFDS